MFCVHAGGKSFLYTLVVKTVDRITMVYTLRPNHEPLLAHGHFRGPVWELKLQRTWKMLEGGEKWSQGARSRAELDARPEGAFLQHFGIPQIANASSRWVCSFLVQGYR